LSCADLQAPFVGVLEGVGGGEGYLHPIAPQGIAQSVLKFLDLHLLRYGYKDGNGCVAELKIARPAGIYLQRRVATRCPVQAHVAEVCHRTRQEEHVDIHLSQGEVDGVVIWHTAFHHCTPTLMPFLLLYPLNLSGFAIVGAFLVEILAPAKG
jgi:hypothetical protein